MALPQRQRYDSHGHSVCRGTASAPAALQISLCRDLTGATIDFVDTIEKQGFTIDNPNATGSCACGDSFH